MKVWISRSRPGADRQAAEIRAAGYQVVVAPVVAIEPLRPAVPAGSFHIVIFVSEHAVRFGLPVLASQDWFPPPVVLAVGARTAAVLRSLGVVVETPGEPSSEGLLAMTPLQRPGGRRVLLIAGVGGRAMLAEALCDRGADVRRLECYRRTPVPALPRSVLDCDVIIAASGEGLEHAVALWLSAGGRADVPVLVPSARVARRGVELGLSNLHDCGGADSDAWLRGLATLRPETS